MSLPKAHSWSTWRVITSQDTFISTLYPGELPAASTGKTICVYPYGAVALRFFGLDTNNDTATIRISGWGDRESGKGVGPGFVIFESASNGVALGNNVWITSDAPLDDGKWSPAAYFEVEDYGTPTTAHGDAIYNTTDGTSLLILPTFGFFNLLLEITDIGGGGTEMTLIGCIYKLLGPDLYNHVITFGE